MKKTLFSFLILLFSTIFWLGCSHFVNETKYQKNYQNRQVSSVVDPSAPWAYDPGPSSNTTMGKELIDLVASQPYVPGISEEVSGDQKFRPPFGPTLWRMLTEPNSVKILFIGQDGTHIAEAAGRTATAGFGGRAQDLAAYFGVKTGAAFINTFAFTIKGQYGAFSTPIISEESGVKKVSIGTVIDNGMWMIAQDQNSPMVKWRNHLIDWIIRNNSQSLKMIVLFGGAAQDSIGTFIESRGGHVGTQYSSEDLKNKKVQIPAFKLISAGSNKVFPVIVDKNGQDLYAKIAGKKLDYSKPEQQKLATDLFRKNINKVFSELVLNPSGLAQSGIIHPAQINGYNLNQIRITDINTLSLKGLKLSDGQILKNDVLVAEFPHPTALSLLPADQASAKIQQSLKQLQSYVDAGWVIDPDSGMQNKFKAGEVYNYSRTDIPLAYYDFGTPKNRMVSKSDASRMTGKPHVVILGTRDKAQFDNNALQKMTDAKPNETIANEEMFTSRPRALNVRYNFDHGPGDRFAKIMKENIDMASIGALKPGYQLKAGVFSKNGESTEELADVDGFNIKTHPIAVGDFGHYRGTFSNPQVIILADPDGYDEILTSKALTGTRGQYLQNLMNKLGFAENHLVIRTVPFGMDNATDTEWNTVLQQTMTYRQKIFEELLKNNKPQLIITDGPYAQKEITKLVPQEFPIISISRQGSENSYGLQEAAEKINQLKLFSTIDPTPKMANIPRSHLGFMSRVWEGTSGSRVLNSTTPSENGIAFAVVVPSWAFTQKSVIQDKEERIGVERLKTTLESNKIYLKKDTFKTTQPDQ